MVFNFVCLQDLSGILASIEERLRLLDTVSAAQVKQARRLDVIQDKLGMNIILHLITELIMKVLV